MTHVHLIGIGGSGLSAIALLLAERGYTVSGSDKLMSPLAQKLAEGGIHVFEGHQAGNIAGADVVVRSSAVGDDNPEVQAARQAGIPVLKRSEFLGDLINGQYSIAVAGTNGKTTTTAMAALVLTRLGLDPGYICGGVIKDLGSNAHNGTGRHFVIEADEYDRMFLGLNPQAAVITNIEHDHPDCFPTWQEYLQAFRDFTSSIPDGGLLVTCSTDPGVQQLLASLPAGRIHICTYSLERGSDYHAAGIKLNMEGGYSFNFLHGSESLAGVTLRIPGEHNILNACAVLALAAEIGLPVQKAAGCLREYSGAGRRFEVRGEAGGVTIIDDYAHHPAAIRATLSAARTRFPGRRITALWQPHTYSRTRRLFNDFTASFENADRVVVTEIYASREPAQDFTSAILVQTMRHPDARFASSLEEARQMLTGMLQPGDVLLVLSAGDADKVSDSILSALRERI